MFDHYNNILDHFSSFSECFNRISDCFNSISDCKCWCCLGSGVCQCCFSGFQTCCHTNNLKCNRWCILQKLRRVKFFYWIFLMKMVKYPQIYPLIPKIPLGWSIKSKFWRIFKCTFMNVKYVVQRFLHRDLIFWSFAYCLTILESSCQHGSDGTQIWASNSMVSS